MIIDLCISAPYPLLSNLTPQLESNVFNHLNKTQSYKYDYDYKQIDGDVDSNLYPESLVNNNK